MKVLLLISDDRNGRELEELLNCCAVVRRIQTVRELQSSLMERSWDVVVSGWSLGRETWKHAVFQARKISPNMPVVVCCHWGGLAEWTQALSYGAFDLMVPPYSPTNVLLVMEQAAESHRARDRMAGSIGAVAASS
jgi:DNA-binding NtrC family response regulator